jgi:DNA (cytosine-5)-methyltransferase 1
VKGNGKVYTKQVVKRLNEIGYNVQVFLLNGATMGVPQTRERVFVVGHKKEYKLPRLILDFNEKPILFGEIIDRTITSGRLTAVQLECWNNQKQTDKNFADVRGRVSGFTDYLIPSDRVCNTIAANCKYFCKEFPRWFTEKEFCQCGTFPIDYKFDKRGAQWYIGMSVPPVMAAQISYQIYKQWLTKIT